MKRMGDVEMGGGGCEGVDEVYYDGSKQYE